MTIEGILNGIWVSAAWAGRDSGMAQIGTSGSGRGACSTRVTIRLRE